MSSFPEVVVPEQHTDDEEPKYEKKPKVDTKRIFKSKVKKSTANEDQLEEMRVKAKPVYDNPMETPSVEMVIEEVPEEPEVVVEVKEEPPAKQVAPLQPEPEAVTLSPKEVEVVENPIVITSSKPVKKKRQMSLKQLEALAKGRETSLKKRQAKAVTKKEIKESNEVQEQPISTPVFHKPPNYLTKEDVEEISVDAITKYDAIRKKRKAVKKEQKTKHIADVKTTQAIQRALNPNDMDFYGDCFNITY